jgi:hypothetical protein
MRDWIVDILGLLAVAVCVVAWPVIFAAIL